MQLVHVNEGEDVIRKEEGDGVSTEWAKFLHKKNEIFVDFDLVREEIVKETTRLVGNGKVSSFYTSLLTAHHVLATLLCGCHSV